MPSLAANMVEVVDTTARLSDLLDILDGLPTSPPSLYLDLEGENLSRHGTIAILQLHVSPHNRTYLIDVHTLQHATFSTPGRIHHHHTLKTILESDAIPKVFFDVRNDSDALHSHFGIRLAGVQDLQLMELATRPPAAPRRLVQGLARCIERDARLPAAELAAWKAAKEAGLRLFDPQRGGSYAVFARRPLGEDVKRYCAQDAEILPRLWARYRARMTPEWWRRVLAASGERVALSQAANYDGKGRQKVLAPVGWY